MSISNEWYANICEFYAPSDEIDDDLEIYNRCTAFEVRCSTELSSETVSFFQNTISQQYPEINDYILTNEHLIKRLDEITRRDLNIKPEFKVRLLILYPSSYFSDLLKSNTVLREALVVDIASPYITFAMTVEIHHLVLCGSSEKNHTDCFEKLYSKIKHKLYDYIDAANVNRTTQYTEKEITDTQNNISKKSRELVFEHYKKILEGHCMIE
jgi:hypothetical protein